MGEPYAFRLCGIDRAGNIGRCLAVRATPLAETDPPEDVLLTLDGGATYTRDRDVVARITGSDDSGLSQVCLSEEALSAADCRVWVDHADIIELELSGGTGEKTMHAWVMDPHGNTAQAPAVIILFDRYAPDNGDVEGSADADTVTLPWSGFEDDLSGVASYVVMTAEETAPDSCSEGREVYRGSDTSVVLPEFDDGRHGFRVCAIDSAGNLSSGEPVRVNVQPELERPRVTQFTPECGATTVCGPMVDLDIQATGAGELTRMCIEETDTCNTWAPFDTEHRMRLDNPEGENTVYMWVRDEFGVESDTPVSVTFDSMVCAPGVAFSSLEVDLGPVCGDTETEITVTNDGSADMTVEDLTLHNSGRAGWSVDDAGLPWVLAPGETRSIELSATVGEAELLVETDVDGFRNVYIPLSATLDTPPSLDAADVGGDRVVLVGDARTLTASVSDPDSAPGDLTVEWISDVDGIFASPTANADGEATQPWDGVGMTAGSHTLTAFDAYVGFTSATGGATNLHAVKSLDVRGRTCDR